ncbi:UNVERIFIED_ORG: YfiR family protein [Shinella sp. XGS7]|nr:YfiR family protein [Shinella sp. XGS7]
MKVSALLLLALLLLLPDPARAIDAEDQLKAAFVYRFVQYTQWPPPPLREFSYCAVGGGGLPEALRVVAAKPLDLPYVRFHQPTTPEQARQCQILLLAFEERAELLRWQRELADAPVLTVGDGAEAFRAGLAIALVLEPNGLSFRINLVEARRRGLTLSSQLLKLAREVR